MCLSDLIKRHVESNVAYIIVWVINIKLFYIIKKFQYIYKTEYSNQLEPVGMYRVLDPKDMWIFNYQHDQQEAITTENALVTKSNRVHYTWKYQASAIAKYEI